VEYSLQWRIAARRGTGFEVFLTVDTNLADQQNLQGRKRAIIVLNRNKWNAIQLVLDKIVDAVTRAKPGSFTVVEIPR
jgi:hypothetical protein